MKKRSKKRIPQDVVPWKRVTQDNDDEFYLVGKKTSRWNSGSYRNRETTVLNAQINVERSKVLLKSFITDQSNFEGDAWNTEEIALRKLQLQYKISKLNRMSFDYKSKNSCFFLGKGRTFNRHLYMSRHTLRKMVRFGIISGLRK